MATVDQTFLKVQRLLTGPMKLKIQLEGDLIGVVFANASTQIHIRVLDWGKTKDGEPRSLVRVTAPILRGVEPKPELFEHIARQAPKQWFGSITVWDDAAEPGKVLLSMGHTLLGDFLDEDELTHALFGVLNAADDLDDQLQQQFGGKRWTDA